MFCSGGGKTTGGSGPGPGVGVGGNGVTTGVNTGGGEDGGVVTVLTTLVSTAGVVPPGLLSNCAMSWFTIAGIAGNGTAPGNPPATTGGGVVGNKGAPPWGATLSRPPGAPETGTVFWSGPAV